MRTTGLVVFILFVTVAFTAMVSSKATSHSPVSIYSLGTDPVEVVLASEWSGSSLAVVKITEKVTASGAIQISLQDGDGRYVRVVIAEATTSKNQVVHQFGGWVRLGDLKIWDEGANEWRALVGNDLRGVPVHKAS